jgi:metallo-beta-lactamase class B
MPNVDRSSRLVRVLVAGFLALASLFAPAKANAQRAALTMAYDSARCPSCAEWNTPQAPLRLFGNTYYVGTHGLTALLITSEQGHILIDGGLPNSAPLILKNIAALGFRATDIKIILNSHAHYDHAGGIAAIQDASGARVIASAASAPVIAHGLPDHDDPQHGIALPMPPVRNVDVLKAGEVVRLGPLAPTLHATGGHSPGGSSWTWRACEGARCLDFVYADSQSPISEDGFRFSDNTRYPNALADFERGHALLERLPCDVLITPHPGASSLWQRAATAPEGLIDRTACKAYAAASRRALRARLEREKRCRLPHACQPPDRETATEHGHAEQHRSGESGRDEDELLHASETQCHLIQMERRPDHDPTAQELRQRDEQP